ncbi:hypothetical protein BD410DRAFT_214085 [Rickenella mellea]|uniref:Uncharacterized protein n=1 Tax=Rickenella mellea TaxID=50990 RepID=A0A4Y7QLN0_9AGAM|nr:hypothetical protein BD410DRAFT_214085 [Rickenella mellea]
MARPTALKMSLPLVSISSAFDSSARSSPSPNSTPDHPIKEETQSPTLGLFAELDANRQSAPLSKKSQNGTSYQHLTMLKHGTQFTSRIGRAARRRVAPMHG